MHVFLELWNPKPTWHSLSAADRQSLMGRLGQATTPIAQAGGIEVLGWGKADSKVDHSEGHQYFAVWRSPTREALDQMREVILKGGWYDYFDQVNVVGELRTPDAVIAEHFAM